MSRIRTTWTTRKADDPRAMNQDHLSQQPADDKYEIGGPSEFAEDVASPDWKGQTRNDIGLPEMRPESLRQAAEMASLRQRAALSLKLASKVLGKTASESLLEDQALVFMNLGDHGVISTLGRIAAAQEEDEEPAEDEEGQDKQAGEMPPQFKENAEKKQEEAAAKKEDEKKEASQEQQQEPEAQAKQAQEQEQAQQEAQTKQAQEQAQQEQDGQAKQAQDQIAQQVTQLAQQLQQLQAQLQQQQVAQQQPAVAQQQPAVAQDQVVQDDVSVLDQMLAEESTPGAMAADDIELFGNGFDTEPAELGTDDQTLAAILAGGQETQDALAAQGCVTASAPVRTVGTRPSAGVAKIASASSRASGSDDALAGMWSAPPDVSSVFQS